MMSDFETKNNNLSSSVQERKLQMKSPSQKVIKKDEKDKEKKTEQSIEIFAFTIIVRLICFALWTGGILFATYHVYLAAEEHLPFYRDAEMNPSLLSSILNRGKEYSDHEWEHFVWPLWTKFILYFVAYQILNNVARELQLTWAVPWSSPIITFVFCLESTGMTATLFLYLVPVIYWLLLTTKRKWIPWIATAIFVLLLNSKMFLFIMAGDEQSSQYSFVVISAWNYARCISFCFDVWDRPEKKKCSFEYLGFFIQYVFYLPLILTGPLVLYHHFENEIILKNYSSKKGSFEQLAKQLVRLLMITLFLELTSHYLYFRPLGVTPIIKNLNLWAVCGCVYWLGQFFTLKYKVMYGVPSCLAEFDGLNMYPLPCCPAYLHRYSVLWKDFDRGLYVFLVRYIYVPIIALLHQLDKRNKIHSEAKKLIASVFTFVYIYLWHSIAFDVFVWSSLNFLGITIERIGSFIKKEVDKQLAVSPLFWDFVVEPIVTVPLAGMSILNSAVFCGSLTTATAFATKLWISRADNYVIFFLYGFTQVSVTIRNWDLIVNEIRVIMPKIMNEIRSSLKGHNKDKLK